jgi:hypothetical protein
VVSARRSPEEASWLEVTGRCRNLGKYICKYFLKLKPTGWLVMNQSDGSGDARSLNAFPPGLDVSASVFFTSSPPTLALSLVAICSYLSLSLFTTSRYRHVHSTPPPTYCSKAYRSPRSCRTKGLVRQRTHLSLMVALYRRPRWSRRWSSQLWRQGTSFQIKVCPSSVFTLNLQVGMISASMFSVVGMFTLPSGSCACVCVC